MIYCCCCNSQYQSITVYSIRPLNVDVVVVAIDVTMPLHERLAVADDDEDALYGILVALMLLLPDAVRDTFPADVLQQNG